MLIDAIWQGDADTGWRAKCRLVLLPVAQIGLGLHSRAAVLWGRGAPSAFQHLFAISLHIFLGSAPASFVLVEILRF
jgi:hypothetical protein